MIHALEVELKRQLDLTLALRGVDFSENIASGYELERAYPASEVQDRVVEEVDELRAELKPLGFREQEIFVEAEVGIRVTRSAKNTRTAGSKCVGSRNAKGAWIPPLDSGGSG